jgi:hypothetical protein
MTCALFFRALACCYRALRSCCGGEGCRQVIVPDFCSSVDPIPFGPSTKVALTPIESLPDPRHAGLAMLLVVTCWHVEYKHPTVHAQHGPPLLGPNKGTSCSTAPRRPLVKSVCAWHHHGRTVNWLPTNLYKHASWYLCTLCALSHSIWSKPVSNAAQACSKPTTV